ncbi:unnamed protein product [Gongylonema pulchrum]|uniref:C2H2-type domain-containing protein n=1 Tax=Gongylonema pulchrum TaxID=637853 RepID=A0A183EL26_9BILA|nr:unnamed protein product [Gongylonema pulchrum]
MRFKNKARLRVHLRHHSGDKITACPYCGVFLASNSKLTDHLYRRVKAKVSVCIADAAKVGDERSVCCSLCHRQFETKRLLREHCRRHVMGYKCNYCIVTADSPSSLRRHIATVHAKERVYPCQFCEQRYFQRADLQRHEAVHRSDYTNDCEQCGESFRWRKQLLAHLRKHDSDYKPYTHLCHLCPAKYMSGFGLSRHLIGRHRCKVPEGFSRFHYKKCKDGFARLQTSRCLSRDLARKMGFIHDEPNSSSA